MLILVGVLCIAGASFLATVYPKFEWYQMLSGQSYEMMTSDSMPMVWLSFGLFGFGSILFGLEGVAFLVERVFFSAKFASIPAPRFRKSDVVRAVQSVEPFVCEVCLKFLVWKDFDSRRHMYRHKKCDPGIWYRMV